MKAQNVFNFWSRKRRIGGSARRRSVRLLPALALAAVALVWAGSPAGFLAQEEPGNQPERVRVKPGQSVPLTLQPAPSGKQEARQAQKAPPEGPHPVAKVVGDATFDFGAFWTGTDITHSFQIKNEGDAVLRIQSVKPG